MSEDSPGVKDLRLKGRVALITGAGRGIGQAIALAYAKEGARLALAARTLSELEDTARQAASLGAETIAIPTDVADRAQVDEMARRTLERFSTIDILVNNAGVPGPVGPLQDNDVAYWLRTIEVNLIGVYLCCRAVLPTMLSRNTGNIINMSGQGSRHLSAYETSKMGLNYLTEVLSTELEGTNVRVNAMKPGPIHTRIAEEVLAAAVAIGDTWLLELNREVPDDSCPSMQRAAELAVFLASDASADLSGRTLDAVTDDFAALPPKIPGIMASDVYTMRRVEPG